MRANDSIWIGVDPGGMGNFGVAILRSDGSASTFLVDCADDAIDAIKDTVTAQPAGVGVDAPLWWSSGRFGSRQADQWLRTRHGLSGGQVQAANSLRGAALVQGMMFVHRIRQLFPKADVTETHPKALWAALEVDSWDTFSTKFSVTANGESEHERDAIISAVAAREGFEGRWLHDLSIERYPREQDPLAFWLAPIHYFWPV